MKSLKKLLIPHILKLREMILNGDLRSSEKMKAIDELDELHEELAYVSEK